MPEDCIYMQRSSTRFLQTLRKQTTHLVLKKKKKNPVFFSIRMLGEADAQVSIMHDITQPYTALWEILFHVDSQLNRRNEPSPLILKRKNKRKTKG